MADPLSIIAGIVGIAAASAHLANTVHDFGDRFNNARSQMHNVGSEMSQLSGILKNLAIILEQGRGKYKLQVLTDTKSIIERVEKVQKEIRRMVKKNSGFRARVRWALSSGKIAELLDRIEALKSSLSIVIATVQLAVALSESKHPELEIERLQQLVISGIKEIRQSVIELQQAKPAVMFEPLRMLAAGQAPSALLDTLEHQGLVLPSAPAKEGSGLELHQEVVAQETTEAVEPSESQFETATWLYRMALTSSADPAEVLPAEDATHNATPEIEQLDWSNELHAMRSGLNVHGPVQSAALVKLPSPQKLYSISIPATAWKLVHMWTFLTYAEVNFEDAAATSHSFDQSAEDDDSDDDDDDRPSDREPLRRRFTLPEYNRALESGSLRGSTQQVPTLDKAQPGPSNKGAEDTPHEPGFRSRPRSSSRAHVEDHLFSEKIFEPPPAPPQPDTTREEELLAKLERVLLGHAEAEQKSAKAKRRAEESAKLDRLEQLLIAQQEAQIAKDKAKQQAAADAAKAAAEMKRRGDEDKLAKLEKLILAQKDEQLKREVAAEAARRAAAVAADAEARRYAEEKKAAAETARMMLDAARRAREEAEMKAAEEAEQTKRAYEQAVMEVKAVAEDLERTLQEQTRLRQEAEDRVLSLAPPTPPLPPPLPPSPPPMMVTSSGPPVLTGGLDREAELTGKVQSAVSKLVDLVYGKEEMKWYMTSSGPSLLDISDGYFARKALITAQDEDDDAASLTETSSSDFGSRRGSARDRTIDNRVGQTGLLQLLTTPGRYHLVFPAATAQTSLLCKDLIAALQAESFETFFEMDPSESKSLIYQLETTLTGASLSDQGSTMTEYERVRGDVFVCSSLLWQRFPQDGQSELYQALCRTGWKPTYLRSSESGQTWFYGNEPVHVRFNRSDYIPRFADFELDTTHACVIIGSDIVDEDALYLTGIDYESLQSGYWMLEPTLNYEDIAALVATSFALRETTLRRTARKVMSNSTSTLSRSNGKTMSPRPDIPALKAFGHSSEPTLGAQENRKSDPAESL